MNNKNKKALSEIVSYVILIVITLSIAALVFAWLRFYVPSENERETCPDTISLFINEYACTSSTPKTLNITLENNGYFNIAGFYIRASDNLTKKPITLLNSTFPGMVAALGPGRHDFNFSNNKHLFPQQKTNVKFDYSGLTTIQRIQIQPYIYPEKGSANSIVLCPTLTEINIENC